MVPENYSPQSESLTHLQTKIEQLQTILNKNDSSKARIFTKVDKLIESIKPTHSPTDINDIINHIKNFIATQPESSQRPHNSKDRPKLTALEELRLQNMELRRIYQSKQEYYEVAVKVNQEYEEAINDLLMKFKTIKHEENVKRINETRVKAITVQQLQKEEFEIFNEYLSVDLLNNKLIGIFSDLIEIINRDVDSDASLIAIYQIIHQLQFYKGVIEKKGDSVYYIEDFDKHTL